MAYFHGTKRKDEAHLNYMGGRSFDLTDPLLQLRVAAASAFFGEPQYYHRDPADRRPRRVVSLSDAEVRHLHPA